MGKIDLTKEFKSYYSAKAKPTLVEVERAKYLSISGKGDPSGKSFEEKVQALYSVAYTLKFICKALNKDFAVAKLEGLWWFDEKRFGSLSISEAPAKVPRGEWEYQLLIRIPDFVKKSMIEEAVQTVVTKKATPLASEVKLHEMEEGKVVQVLHVGPFDKEPETLKLLGEYMDAHGFVKQGLHHEIYLSDFRKTAPPKLKTILREPVN